MRDADGKLLTGRRARALPRIDIHPSACDSSKHVVNPLSISYSVCQRLHTIVKPVSQEAIEVLADSVCAVNMRAATLNCPLAGSVVAPGDTVFRLTDEVTTIRLGAMLSQTDDLIVTARAGAVQADAGNKLWVKGRQKRYLPVVDDLVLGVVTEVHGESFTVDIGGPSKGTLNALLFEGATRRNRPDVKEGALLYCKVETASRDVDPTLTCVDAASGKGQGMGLLSGGFSFPVSSALARSLFLSGADAPVVAALAKHITYEFAVGINGRIWVHAPTTAAVVTITAAIQNAEFLSPIQVHIMVDEMVKKMGAGT